MTISYRNEKDFYDGIYQLLTRGVGFDADYEHLTIKLNGGY